MTIYGVNTGKSILANAICGRCKMRFPYVGLQPDVNSPGLRVCARCADEKDPYTLPPNPPDRFTLQFPRPDRMLNDD